MKKAIWTIFFMILLTTIFISALASINELTKERIAQSLQIERYKSVLYAFNIFPTGEKEQDFDLKSTTADIPWQQDKILTAVQQQIKIVKFPVTAEQKKLLQNSYLTVTDSVEIYLKTENDSVVALGFPLRGKGLWGTITAFGVVSANLEKMVGIDFTEQSETPGLGARILEIEFKRFFRNLDISGFLNRQSNAPVIIMVNKKTQTNLEKSTNALQAITGATQTCDGVLKMVNTDLAFFFAVIRANRGMLH